jgi:hypothetical protein
VTPVRTAMAEGGEQGRTGHGSSGGSSKVLPRPTIPYYSMPSGWSNPDRPNGCQGVGQPQGKVDRLVTVDTCSPKMMFL